MPELKDFQDEFIRARQRISQARKGGLAPPSSLVLNYCHDRDQRLLNSFGTSSIQPGIVERREGGDEG
jgi:hypothetical protein